MIAAYYGHVLADQTSGQETDDFSWSRVGDKVIIVCKGCPQLPLSVQALLDEPWLSAAVLAPYPVVPETKNEGGGGDFYGEEEPTEVYQWTMIPTQRNMAYIEMAQGSEDGKKDTLITIEIQSLPDVKTKEEFDATPPRKIRASFHYIVQFNKDPKARRRIRTP